MTWPILRDHKKQIPLKGEGSFWHLREDRRHCGVDLYAPSGLEVVAASAGKVVRTGNFTHPKLKPYWNHTEYVIVENKSGIFMVYAELGRIFVVEEQEITEGHPLGLVGQVLNQAGIDKDTPKYVRDLIRDGKSSMLHFEMHSSMPDMNHFYSAGNWFGEGKPESLIDPKGYLLIQKK